MLQFIPFPTDFLTSCNNIIKIQKQKLNNLFIYKISTELNKVNYIHFNVSIKKKLDVNNKHSMFKRKQRKLY